VEAFDFNLRHLRAFVSTANCGSLSGAAREVNLSQSAITQAIAKLERQLELPMFERQPSGVALTEAGRLLFHRACAALDLIGSNRVTASQVRTFVSLAKHGSYVATAIDTGIRQPSLHRSIADLAANLGQRLVERRGRGVVVTQRGVAVARQFQLAEAELRAGLDELEALKGREVGRVVVGAMPLCRAKLLPKVIAAFNELYPDVEIAVIEGSFAEIAGPLRNGDIDLVIGALRDREGDDLVQEALFADRPIIVGRSGHPLARSARTTADQLARYPWIISREGTPLRAQWHELFKTRAAGPPRVAVETGSVVLTRQLLIDGDFLTLLSPDQVASEIEIGRLSRIGSKRLKLSRTIGTISRAGWRPTRLQQAFVDLLVRESGGSAAKD
jgi:DNA-binding transcriptional LysR family regulator